MASSYGVVRRTTILGQAGTTWYVHLYKKDYTGVQKSMDLFGEGFDVKWSGSGGTRDRRFIESECVINLLVQNDTDESLLYDIFESGDRNYFVRIYKNEETTKGLWWFGWVHPSFSTIENSPFPYKSKISSTDSIGTFKKSPDSDLTTAQYSNTSNINQHIKEFGSDMGVYQGWATNLIDDDYFLSSPSDWTIDSPATWSIPSESYDTPSVGDSVGGGIVFKVVGSKVYVSSEVDLGDFEWGCFGTEIGSSSEAIGTGEQNTLDIVAGCSDTDSAAYMCNDATINGYSDWYLPSKDELIEMYNNKTVIGGFSSDWYWSSSEYLNNYARVIHLGFGYTNSQYKNTLRPVRAIRSYTAPLITTGGGRADATSVAGYMSQNGVSVTSGQTVSFTFTVQNYGGSSNTLTLRNESGLDLSPEITIDRDGTYVETFDALENSTGIRLQSSFGGSYSITNLTLVDGYVDEAPMPQITNWFYTSIDWWRDGDTYQSDDPFYLYRTGRTLFRDDVEKFPSKYSKYKVLDGTLKVFNTVGVLSNGRYNFIQPNQYANNTSGDFRFYQYATGSTRDTSPTNENHLLTIDGTINADKGAVLAGSTLTYEPPFKSVAATFLNSSPLITIPPNTDFTDYGFVGNIQEDTVSTDGSLNTTFRFQHEEKLLTSEVVSGLTSGYDLANKSFKTIFTWNVKLTDGTQTKYLKKNSTAPWWTWETTEANNVIEVGYESGESNFNGNGDDSDIFPCKMTHTEGDDYYIARSHRVLGGYGIPLPPFTGAIYIKLTGVNEYSQWKPGTSFGGEYAYFNDSLLTTIVHNNYYKYNSTITDDNSESINEEAQGIRYTSNNNNVVSEELFDFKDVIIGNTGSVNYSINNPTQANVQYLNTDGSSVSAIEGFREGGSGTYKNITQLLCNEFLSLQTEPLEILQADIFSPDISPLKLLKYSISDDGEYKYYSFLGGSFKAMSETMNGEWFKINSSTDYIISDENINLKSISTSDSNKIQVDRLGYIEAEITKQNAIAISNANISAGSAITKFNFDGTSLGKVYDNQKLIIRNPYNGEYLIVVVDGTQDAGSSAIDIDSITPSFGLPIGSTLSVLTYDLSNVITGGSSVAAPQTDVIHITSTEYQALGGTSITLVDSPGVGKVIIPLSIYIYANRLATETSSVDLYIGDTTSTSSGSFYTYIRDFMNNESGRRTYVAPPTKGEIAQGTLENRRMQIYSNGTFNGDISLTVYITYQIMDV
jgi:hypothetical protein